MSAPDSRTGPQGVRAGSRADVSAPESSPAPRHGRVVAHAFSDIDGTGLCVCGRPRMTGVHVAETDEDEQLRIMAAQSLGAITGELLALQTYLQRLGVLGVES